MPPPLVSIVTPCLNAVCFIEETIQSVLRQDYPALEYIVMDGGSTDGTIGILKRYQGRLAWHSAKDNGQADAVNRGFALTHGEIFAFLNADDTYLPGAVAHAVEGFEGKPEPAVVYGDAWYVDENGRRTGRYPVEPFAPDRFQRRCFICQPAAFIRRNVFAAARGLDTRLRYAMDYDLWIRIAESGFVKIDCELATSRLHAGAKTVAQQSAAMRETIQVLRRHYGYAPFNWVYGYIHNRRCGQAVAAAPPRLSLASAAPALAWGFGCNWRHPVRYVRDVLGTAREGIACAGQP